MGPLIRSSMTGRLFPVGGSLSPALFAQGGYGVRNISTSQAGKVASAFFKTTTGTWNAMHYRGSPLGEKVWSNPKATEILKSVNQTVTEGDGHKGAIGWHATTAPEEILAQAKSHPEGCLEERPNACGEGLYLGTPENAVHYTGGSTVFQIASTCRLGQNDDYGTGTTYLRPGTGDTYCVEAWLVRDEYKEFQMPYTHKAVTGSLVSGVKAAVELYRTFEKS